MPFLINQYRVMDDDWARLVEDQPVSHGRVIISVERLLREHERLPHDNVEIGVELEAAYDIEKIGCCLPLLHLVALQFDDFADGRAFSQARLLRQRYAFSGHIRARGQVLRDQLGFMLRCGFDQFELAQEGDVGLALRAFEDITDSYQVEPRRVNFG